MNTQPVKQLGGSLLSNLFFIAVLAYGAYLGIQYVPQALEARSVQTTLDSMLSSHEANPVPNAQVALDRLHNMLNMSDLDYMAESFQVKQKGGAIVVTARYDRELDMLYRTRTINYEKSVTLH